MTDAMARGDPRPEQGVGQPAQVDRARIRWLLGSLALQNLGRRKARTLLLVVAVAVGSGVVFTSAVLMRSIERSMAVGLHPPRRGFLIVSGRHTHQHHRGAADRRTDRSDLGRRAAASADQPEGRGAGRAQQILRTQHSGYGHQHEPVDLIAFDPQNDFTVQPWLEERLDRPMQTGDIIIGGRRDDPLGSEILLFGAPSRSMGGWEDGGRDA